MPKRSFNCAVRNQFICLCVLGFVVSLEAGQDETELKKRMEIAKKEWMDRQKANEEAVKEAISSKRFDVLLDALKTGYVSHETYFRILEVLQGSGNTERLIDVLKQHNQMQPRGGIEAMHGLADTRWSLMKVIAADLGMILADSDGYIEFLKKGSFTLEENNLAWNRAILRSDAFADEAKALIQKTNKAGGQALQTLGAGVAKKAIVETYVMQAHLFREVLVEAKMAAEADPGWAVAVDRLAVTSLYVDAEKGWADCLRLIESGDSRLVQFAVLTAGTFDGFNGRMNRFPWKKEQAEGLVLALEEMLPRVEEQGLGEGGASLCFRADFYVRAISGIFGVEFTGSLPAGTAEVREWVVAELDKLWQVVDDAKSKNQLRAWIALIRDSPRATEVLELNDEIKAMLNRGESLDHLLRKRVYPPERPLLNGNVPAGGR